jgi:hypothetical protein
VRRLWITGAYTSRYVVHDGPTCNEVGPQDFSFYEPHAESHAHSDFRMRAGLHFLESEKAAHDEAKERLQADYPLEAGWKIVTVMVESVSSETLIAAFREMFNDRMQSNTKDVDT